MRQTTVLDKNWIFIKPGQWGRRKRNASLTPGTQWTGRTVETITTVEPVNMPAHLKTRDGTKRKGLSGV